MIKIKNIFRFLIIILILTSLTLSITSADMNKPEFIIGDYWEYDIKFTIQELNLTINGTSRIEILGIQNITIDNSEYNTYIVSDNIILRDNYSNYTLDLSSSAFKYYRISDNSLLSYHKISLMYGYSEIVYSYPFVGLLWPIREGISWKRSTTGIYTNSSGSSSEEITFYYDCIGEQYVNTNAGTFQCYIIKIHTGSDKNYTLSYRSPDVGYFEVKSEEYQNNILIRDITLKSYKYSPLIDNEEEKSNADNNNPDQKNTDIEDTPFLEIIFILITLILIVISKNKKKI